MKFTLFLLPLQAEVDDEGGAGDDSSDDDDDGCGGRQGKKKKAKFEDDMGNKLVPVVAGLVTQIAAEPLMDFS